MKKTSKKFKITIGAAGLIVSSLASGTLVQLEKEDCSALLASSVCSERESCEEITMADVLRELKESGCLKKEDIERAINNINGRDVTTMGDVLKELERNGRVRKADIEVMLDCGSTNGF